MITAVKQFITNTNIRLKTFVSKRASSPVEVERAEYMFYMNYLRPGMVVFDVGANIGGLTMLFSKFVSPSGSVHAFECNHNTFTRLKLIIGTFCSDEKDLVFLNEVGLSDYEGEQTLYEYQQGNGDWTTLARRDLSLPSGEPIVPVKSRIMTSTLDRYCGLHSVSQIDLLKIDVEGAELSVLRGAQNLLSTQRVKCITFEFGQTLFDMGNTPAEIIEFLQRYGYSIRNLIPGDPLFPGGLCRETAMFSMHVSTPRK